jgi:signal peptidase II
VATPRPLPIYKDWLLLQLAALVFLLDQFSKFLVREFIPFQDSFPARGLVRITHNYNTGSAFGLFQGQNTALIFVAIIGITVLIMIYRSQPRPSNLMRLSLGMQIGGAAGNLLDRLHLGQVTDFIDVGPWPVFNLADASIVTGILLLVWLFLGPNRARGREAANQGVAGVGALQQQDGYRDAYSWCPVCEGDMVTVPGGWRCSSCGVRETIG